MLINMSISERINLASLQTLNMRTMWTKLACGCTKEKVPLIKG